MKTPRFLLKEGAWFACYGDGGWADGTSGDLEGVFFEDVRLLDLWEARFEGREFTLARVDDGEGGRDAERLIFDAIAGEDHGALEPAKLHSGALVLSVERRVGRAGLVETLRLENRAGTVVSGRLEVELHFEMADVAEARGVLVDRREREVELDRPREDALFAHYRAGDDFQVACLFTASRPFDWEEDGLVAFPVQLRDGEVFEVELRFGAVVGEGTLTAPTGEMVDRELERAVAGWRRSCPEIETDDDATNELLVRASDDLRMLWTWTGREAGFFASDVPHRVAARGREGGLASLFFLMMLPEQARWTLSELARHQGRKVHPLSGEQPGKMPHEVRRGERTHPDDHPEAYASVGPTLIFPILLDAYLAWSGDLDFARELEPALRGVLDWCGTFGDANGDALLDFPAPARRAPRGWAERRAPEPVPIALVEHQGLARDALLACERMLRLLDDPGTAQDCRAVADGLRDAFVEAFWWPEEACFAHGLDREGRRIERVGSGQGYALAGDLIPVELRDEVVGRLMRPDSFGGFGLRSAVRGAVGASPYRADRGAVAPEDTAFAGFGMHVRGYRTEANRLASGILRAASSLPGSRLAGRLVGLDAEEAGGRATVLPGWGGPHATAAAAPFHLLRGALGLFPDALERAVTIKPDLRGLPFQRVSVRDLRVAGGELSFDVLLEGDESRVVPVKKNGDLVVRL